MARTKVEKETKDTKEEVKEVKTEEKSPSKKTKTEKKEEKTKDSDDIEKLKVESLNEIENLKAELKAEIELLRQQKEELLNHSMRETSSNSSVHKKIDNDTEITVISLSQGLLNLCTEPNGGGIVYTLSEMYEETEIPYEDIRNIVRCNRAMAENGRFYINNKEVVKKLRLNHFYDNILSPDDLKSLITNDSKHLVELYNNANEAQKEVIKDILVEGKRSNNIDMNLLTTFEQLTDFKFEKVIV